MAILEARREGGSTHQGADFASQNWLVSQAEENAWFPVRYRRTFSEDSTNTNSKLEEATVFRSDLNETGGWDPPFTKAIDWHAEAILWPLNLSPPPSWEELEKAMYDANELGGQEITSSSAKLMVIALDTILLRPSPTPATNGQHKNSGEDDQEQHAGTRLLQSNSAPSTRAWQSLLKNALQNQEDEAPTLYDSFSYLAKLGGLIDQVYRDEISGDIVGGFHAGNPHERRNPEKDTLGILLSISSREFVPFLENDVPEHKVVDEFLPNVVHLDSRENNEQLFLRIYVSDPDILSGLPVEEIEMLHSSGQLEALGVGAAFEIDLMNNATFTILPGESASTRNDQSLASSSSGSSSSAPRRPGVEQDQDERPRIFLTENGTHEIAMSFDFNRFAPALRVYIDGVCVGISRRMRLQSHSEGAHRQVQDQDHRGLLAADLIRRWRGKMSQLRRMGGRSSLLDLSSKNNTKASGDAARLDNKMTSSPRLGQKNGIVHEESTSSTTNNDKQRFKKRSLVTDEHEFEDSEMHQYDEENLHHSKSTKPHFHRRLQVWLFDDLQHAKQLPQCAENPCSVLEDALDRTYQFCEEGSVPHDMLTLWQKELHRVSLNSTSENKRNSHWLSVAANRVPYSCTTNLDCEGVGFCEIAAGDNQQNYCADLRRICMSSGAYGMSSESSGKHDSSYKWLTEDGWQCDAAYANWPFRKNNVENCQAVLGEGRVQNIFSMPDGYCNVEQRRRKEEIELSLKKQSEKFCVVTGSQYRVDMGTSTTYSPKLRARRWTDEFADCNELCSAPVDQASSKTSQSFTRTPPVLFECAFAGILPAQFSPVSSQMDASMADNCIE